LLSHGIFNHDDDEEEEDEKNGEVISTSSSLTNPSNIKLAETLMVSKIRNTSNPFIKQPNKHEMIDKKIQQQRLRLNDEDGFQMPKKGNDQQHISIPSSPKSTS